MVASPAAAPVDATHRTYDPDWFALLDKVEDRHFWFRARRRVVGALARSAVAGAAPGYRVLEIGCGNGGLLSTLQSACVGGDVIGADLFFDGLRRARERSTARLVQCDVRKPPFGRSFRLIGMFDVLEHLADDIGALRDARDMLDPGGALLVTVPAHAWLWSYFDEASDHRRRYSPTQLRDRLTEAGLRVEYQSQFMAALTPMMWLSRKFRGKSQKNAADDLKIVPVVNGVMNAATAMEAALMAHRWCMPIGTSLVALAFKDKK